MLVSYLLLSHASWDMLTDPACLMPAQLDLHCLMSCNYLFFVIALAKLRIRGEDGVIYIEAFCHLFQNTSFIRFLKRENKNLTADNTA